MKFNYQARVKTGEIQSGVVEASSKEAAFDALRNYGLYVTFIEEAKMPFYARDFKFLERTTKKDIVIFSRQLAIMFKSKVPLIEILMTLGKQVKGASFKEKIFNMAKEIEGGSSLSKALAMYPKLFTPFYINMVRAGEASGKLVDVFLYLADYLEKENNLRSKIIGALIYPAFVILVFVAVVVIIMVYVIPQLVTVLEESGEELPLLTRMVISSSNFMKTQGWIILLVLAVIGFALYRFFKSDFGRAFIDERMVRAPLFGVFFQKLYLARFALNLSTLISGGIPIAQALEITGEVVGNRTYKEIALETRDEVKKGQKISSVLERHPKVISPFFFQMVVVGEKTGTIDTSLNNVVEFYEKEVDRGLDAFIKLLEPIMIIVLGVVVGGLMGAILIPIYSISMV